MWAASPIRQLSPSLILKLIAPVVTFAIVLLSDSVLQISIFSLIFFLIALIIYRFDPTNVWVAFAVPWLIIIFFAILPVSEYTREISIDTVQIIVLIITIGLLILPSSGALNLRLNESYLINKKLVIYIFIAYLSMAALNALYAGYVPIIRLALTGESNYMGFGLKGFYGFYNAFANALGLIAFYFWVTNGDKFYRRIFFTVLLLFLLFMTRQNIISLLIESFIVYNYSIRKYGLFRLIALIITALLVFGAIGDFRLGGGIGELARIKDEYSWIPSAGSWLYAYSYFNLLNLDNTVADFSAPVMDLSSVSGLIPSFLRPEFDYSENVLEVSSFTVGSFMAPIYRDLGFWALIILFALFCFLANHYYRKIFSHNSFESIAIFSIIYFCFLFSFFENFWFYLPIIFQIPILIFFRKVLMKTVKKSTTSN
jgi:oligosaccharide repeat unit polymerase